MVEALKVFSVRCELQRKKRVGQRVFLTVFNRAFGPVDEGVVLLFVGNATKPGSTLYGAHEGHVRTAARTKARGHSEVDVLCMLVRM